MSFLHVAILARDFFLHFTVLVRDYLRYFTLGLLLVILFLHYPHYYFNLLMLAIPLILCFYRLALYSLLIGANAFLRVILRLELIFLRIFSKKENVFLRSLLLVCHFLLSILLIFA